MRRKVVKLGLAAISTASGTVFTAKALGFDPKATGFVRFGRAVLTIGGIVVDYKISLRGLDQDSQKYADVMSEVHWRSAKAMHDLCCLNGGCFIKVGQHLGSLEYLIPMEYVKTLQVLHDDAPKTPVSELLKVIKEEFGKDATELFDNFSPEPLGTASLAQVHKATLKDGTLVAVKVQHPYVRSYSKVDMKTMDLLVKIVALIFPEFQFKWLAEETKKNLPKELNFALEGENCERVGKMLQKFDYLKVPKIYWELSTERILTMEFCEGGKVNDREYIKRNNISSTEVSRGLGRLYSEMIFVNGYVHCDPHPGNILVKKDGKGTKIILLDHGLYQNLTPDFRHNYCKMWMAIINADIEKIKFYSEKLNCGHVYGLFACMISGRSWKAVTGGVGKEFFSDEENERIKQEASSLLPQIVDVLNSVPREMLLLFKTNDLIRGLECSLKTRASASSFLDMSRCCVRSLASNELKNNNSWFKWFTINLKKTNATF